MTIEDIQGLIISEAEQYNIDPNNLKDQSLKIELTNPEIEEGIVDDIDSNIIFDTDECTIKLTLTLY